MITGAGIPRQGNPIVSGDEQVGEVTSGTLSPCLEVGIGMGYVRSDLAEPGPRSRSTSGASVARPRSASGRSTPRTDRFPAMADESYPDDLRYHPEHDWARVEGDTATFGVTWYAQDALGEVVFYEPPEVGKEVKKDEAYAEVESVKAVSDVYAPLSGEVTEVNSDLSENPEKINQDPYGDGWMVKVKLSDPSEVDALMDAAAYKKLLEDSD